ncbi:hypothetical protein [Roseateles sp.]|uniref:hypothetical protein n=1 Tax=Roseateles sp. TaxID=1971397 RepID=UPI0025E65B9A|nr:hypothetical protein [Roseateles sp.]MBV8035108.1 hypothetical protein [Roseateles sp.]
MTSGLTGCLARTLGPCGLLCALAGGAAQAQELPDSPGCHAALKALNDAEDALMDSADAAPPDARRQSLIAARLRPLRLRVADACLGGLTTSPPPSQHTWVAPALPARSADVLPRVTMPAPVTVPMPRVEAPVTVTHCTSAACFSSDGATLIRVGPTLVGPRGSCTVQGVFVNCP